MSTPFPPGDDDELQRLVRRAAALPDAPPEWVAAAVGLFPIRPRPNLSEVAQAGLRLVHAVLSFDSWAQPSPALGMRATPAATRHLLFSAEGRDVDLRITPQAEHYALSGQVLGPDEAGVVEVQGAGPDDGGAPALLAALDALGEFRLDGLRGGTYRLALRVGSDRIVLPPVEVGASD